MHHITAPRRACGRVWAALQQTWLRALLYIAAIPLFPEYVAPVLGILALAATWRDARAARRVLSVGLTGKLLLLYLVYQALTLPFAKMPLASLESYCLWFFLFLTYLALTNLLSDRQRSDDALYALTLSAGLVGLIGCVQYFLRFLGLAVPLQLWEPVDTFVYGLFSSGVNLAWDGVRVASTFSNPNIAGQYFVIIVPFAAYYAFHGKTARRRTVCRFCLLAIIGCAGFTFSRGTYLALLMVALVLTIANIRSIVTILLSALSALLLVPDAVWNRLMSVGSLDPSSLERLNVWEICLGLIAKDPLFGSGCGVQYTWTVMTANHISAPHAHNIVLQLLVEGGLVGLCLMLCIGLCVTQSALTLLNRKESRALGATFIAFVVGFCTDGMVEYGFTFPKIMAAFAVVLALTDALCALQLNRALSPLTETLTLGGRLFGTRRAASRKG